MIGLLVTLLILLIVFAVVWWLASMIPIPAQFRWVVNVLLGLILLILLLSILFGGVSVPWVHGSLLR
ncbi:MAG: hypothetical protein RB191_18590 [Terriglobia bacterium]|nr:hypothetical protein [Terriglobia bacterium]